MLPNNPHESNPHIAENYLRQLASSAVAAYDGFMQEYMMSISRVAWCHLPLGINQERWLLSPN